MGGKVKYPTKVVWVQDLTRQINISYVQLQACENFKVQRKETIAKFEPNTDTDIYFFFFCFVWFSVKEHRVSHGKAKPKTMELAQNSMHSIK